MTMYDIIISCVCLYINFCLYIKLNLYNKL